jgi:hypothetical protein
MSGRDTGAPKIALSVLRRDTSTSGRGISFIFENDATVSARPISSSVPRSTNSNIPRGSRLRAISRRSAVFNAFFKAVLTQPAVQTAFRQSPNW